MDWSPMDQPYENVHPQQDFYQSIANITALCHGINPEDQRLNQNQMRRHYIDCLEAKCLTPFPATIKRHRKPLTRHNMLN